MILRCTQSHSFPFRPLVRESKFSSSLIPKTTVPSSPLPCSSLPKINTQVGGVTFTPHTRFYERCRNTSFCSKIKIHLSVSPHLEGLPVLYKSRWKHLDHITWMKPSCPQPRPITTHALIVQVLMVRQVQTALRCLPSLAQSSAKAEKAQSLISSLSSYTT